MQSNIKKKEVLRENAKELPKDRMEALLNEMSKTHADGVGALLKEREGHFEDIKLKQETSDEEDENTCHEKLDEVPDMIKLRSEIVGNLSKKISETHQEQNKVEMSSIIKKGLKFIARAAVPIAALFAFVQPQRALLVMSVSTAFSTTVELLDVCGNMWSWES